MRFRWLLGMLMVGGGVIAVSWGLFDVVQVGECGGDGAPPCPTEIVVPIVALAAGFMSAIFGAILSRSGRLLMGFFGLLLTTGALAVYLSLFGSGAAAGSDPAQVAAALPAGLGGLGVIFLLISAKPKAPGFSGSGGSSWGGDGWSGDSDSSSGCSSGCGGGCGGGGD